LAKETYTCTSWELISVLNFDASLPLTVASWKRINLIEIDQHIGKNKSDYMFEVLGDVPPHGGMLTAQHQPKKSNTHQPLIEVRIQRLRCLLERYKGETVATLMAVTKS
jgi:hypothetical protein